MLDDRTIRAARNNAQWCDAVCRAHGNPGEFHEDIWINRCAVPRFYPNAGTLAAPSKRQIDLIDELLATPLPRGWAVKDSFAVLELASRGFTLLFDAEWIYLSVAAVKDLAAATTSARWEVVRDGRALAEWESAWSASTADKNQERVFLPSLIANPEIAIVVGYRDSRIIAGAIANRSDGVVDGRTFLRRRRRS